jgi:hypothetical protein
MLQFIVSTQHTVRVFSYSHDPDMIHFFTALSALLGIFVMSRPVLAAGGAGAAAAALLSTVAVKLPDFWEQDPKFWLPDTDIDPPLFLVRHAL